MKEGDRFLLQLEVTRLLELAKRQTLINEAVNTDELILSDQQRKCIAECKN